MASKVVGLLAFLASASLAAGQFPGQPLQSETCNSELNANYNGTLLNNQTADNLGDCCYRCQKYQGCNIYVFCPVVDGCDNGYGITVRYRECNLKYQNLSSTNASSIAVWSRGSATPFSSGQTGLLLPLQPPAGSAPSTAPSSLGPAPNLSIVSVQTKSHDSSSAAAIAGGVAGGVGGIALVLLTLGCWFGWCRCGQRKGMESDPEAVHAPNYFDSNLQKQISMDKTTELAEFHAALKARGSSIQNDSLESSPISSSGETHQKMGFKNYCADKLEVKDGKQGRKNSGELIKAQSGEMQGLSIRGSGVLEAGLLLQQVGPEARQTTVGVAFADEEAATHLAGDELQETWKIDPKDLQVKMRNNAPVKLGQGGCGSVYLGVLCGMRDVAIKVVNNPDEKQQARFMREIMMLKACHDPNIVQFLGAAIHREQTLLVMTYMPGGDLYQQLAKDSTGAFRWKQRGRSIALDVIKGLSFLHRHQIMHLDIKSPNILLTNSWEARIADVGLGMKITEDGSIATQGASYMWAAPEQLLGEALTTAADIFSLGTVIWELCSGQQPHRRQCRPLLPQEAPLAISELVHRCRLLDPAARPTISEVYREVFSAA